MNLSAAIAEFERDAYSQLGARRMDLVLRGGPGIVNVADSLNEEMAFLAMMIDEVHELCIEEETDAIRTQARNPGVLSMPMHRLAALLKLFFYPLRAYQDALYRIGLVATGALPGKGSMTSVVACPAGKWAVGNPVAEILATALPEYAAWFCSIRRIRDNIKYGVGVSYSIAWRIQERATVAIKISDPNATNMRELAILDVGIIASALSMSAKATTVILSALPKQAASLQQT